VRHAENCTLTPVYEGGHGGAANNEQAAFMSALAYKFLWDTLK
jgi:prolyl oligopeptidase PreP (S9A serine peptidase family)